MSYLRLRNIEWATRLPKHIFSKGLIQKALGCFVSGQNLLTFYGKWKNF